MNATVETFSATLIAVTDDRCQIVAPGIRSVEHAKNVMKMHIAVSRRTSQKKVRRYILVVTMGDADAVHVYDQTGQMIAQHLLPTGVAS